MINKNRRQRNPTVPAGTKLEGAYISELSLAKEQGSLRKAARRTREKMFIQEGFRKVK